jgi:hypothetical protein
MAAEKECKRPEPERAEGTCAEIKIGESGLEVVHPRAAGVDIDNSATMWRCVPVAMRSRYGGLSVSRQTCILWRIGLEVCGIDSVAMPPHQTRSAQGHHSHGSPVGPVSVRDLRDSN